MSNKPKPKKSKGLPQFKIVEGGEVTKVNLELPASAPNFKDIVESVDSFTINREARLVEEQVLTMVMIEHLGRDPQEADWRECSIGNFIDDPTRSQFAHKGVFLGTIVRSTATTGMYDKNGPVRYTVIFEPAVPKTKGDA